MGEDGRNKIRPYLLRGRVICAVCDLPMRASPEKKDYRTYRCASREKPGGPCGGKRVPAPLIETGVWEQIKRILRDPAIIAAEVKRRREEGPDPALLADQEATKRRLATLEKQQAKLLRAFRETEGEALPWDLIKRELAHIEHEKVRIEETRENIAQRMAEQEAALSQLETITTYCQRVAQNMTTFDFDEKRLALEALNITAIANGRTWRLTGSIPLEEQAGTVSQTSAHYVPRPRPLRERV
jgi:site-specific DNA recombinase